MSTPEWPSDEVVLDKPNSARMYDYFLGGSHNFAIDRRAADAAIALNPDTPRSLWACFLSYGHGDYEPWMSRFDPISRCPIQHSLTQHPARRAAEPVPVQLATGPDRSRRLT